MTNFLAQRARNMQALGVLGPQQGRARSVVSYDPVRQVQQVGQAQQALARTQPQGDPYDGIRALASVQQPQGGGGGALGTILNNPIGRSITGALGVLDMPRRVVLSGLQEGVDVFGGGDASFGDFFDQVGDETFGFGTIVGNATGNKWLDRALGFVGDVAFDPLTYLTFGAGKFAGSAGRIAATQRLAAAGGDAQSLARVGRLGVLGAQGPERAAIFAGLEGADSLARPGFRFAGRRIPGTGGLAEVGGRGLAETRAAIGDRMPRLLREARYERGFEDAYRTLRSGQGNTADALAMITHAQARKGRGGRFEARWANDADRLHRELDRVDSAAVMDELEAGGELSGVAADVRQFFDDVYADAAPSITGVSRRENFVPHLFTREAREALADRPIRVNGRSFDASSATGSAIQRKIGPDTTLTLPDGSEVRIVSGTAREINEKLGPALGVGKVIEDDLGKVLHPYVLGIAESVGRADAARAIAPILGIGDEAFEAGVDDVATRARDRAVRGRGQELGRRLARDGRRTGRAAAESGSDVQRRLVDALQGEIGAIQGSVRAAARSQDDAVAELEELMRLRSQITGGYAGDVAAAEQRLADLGAERTAAFTDDVIEREAIAQGRREGKLVRDRERIAAKRAGETPPAGPIPETQAAREAAAFADRRLDDALTDFDRRADAIRGTLSADEAEAQRWLDRIDASRVRVRQATDDAVAVSADANTRLAELERLLRQARKAKVRPKKRTPDAFMKARDELRAVAEWGDETTFDLMEQWGNQIARLSKIDESQKAVDRIMRTAKKGDLTPVMKTQIKDGYERLSLDLLDEADAPVVRSELARQLQNLETAMDDKDFWKVVDTYTKFFKTYATATPGFHFRNGMSATFMNATDGVSVRNMRLGARLWERFSANPRGATPPPGVTTEQYEDAIRAVFMSGGGEGQFGRAEIKLGDSRLTNNVFTRMSQRIGGRVEGYARMGMAIDSILAGETAEQAAARIARIHFDYSQVSRFDTRMKRIIPFWTFLSRNVPLQIQQMVLKPRMYQAYQSLVRNMGEDYEADMVPLYWQEAGAFKVGDSTYLAPDLPHVRLEEDFNKLFGAAGDPTRILADANPLLKVPLETMVADERFFTGQPFEEGGVEELDGTIEALAPALRALGLVDTAADGTEVVDERTAYAFRNLLPPVGQLDRLVASDDPYVEDRRTQSRFGYFGLPVKRLTPRQMESEARRRAFEAREVDARERALREFQARR